MDERISAMAPQVLLEHRFCKIAGFGLILSLFCIFEFSYQPKVSASLVRNLAKPGNVVGNSMTTQPSDSNSTKNEQTNNKKRKFEQ